MLTEIEKVLPSEIEKRSFEIITEELGDKKLVPGTELIVKRCIIPVRILIMRRTVFSEGAVEHAMDAIRRGTPIVTDTQMGKARGSIKENLQSLAVKCTALCRMKM